MDIDTGLVRALLDRQFSQWAGLPIEPVASTATVNAIYRLGKDMVVRLPRVQRWAGDVEKEVHWLPRLEPHLTLAVPRVLGRGRPVEEYPFHWAIYRWIDGQLYADGLVDDERRSAIDLGQFVAELRRIDLVVGAPPGGRPPLRELDALTRAAMRSSRDVIDSNAAVGAWERALRAPAWDGTPVWIHADLLRPNLLVQRGRLSAVLDFGSCGVGDPASDVIAAWSVFSQVGRETFRSALDVDDGTWRRACGFALHQAAMIIPYYSETNPRFVESAVRTVEEILADETS